VTSVSTSGGTNSLAAGGSYSYDPAGNTIARPGQTLTWSPEGKLATVTAGPVTTANTYDADANLALTADNAGTTVYFDSGELYYDATAKKKTATRYYGFGGNTVAVRTSAGGLSWLASDHHGTDDLAIAAHGTTAASVRRSDPFGNPRGTQPTWPGSHGFVGGIQQGTGLTHVGAREYDPTQGRFISVDPQLKPDDPQQLNAYSYASNNPTTMSDPTGKSTWEDGMNGSTHDSHADPSGGAPQSAPVEPPKPASKHDFGASCPPGEATSCLKTEVDAGNAERGAAGTRKARMKDKGFDTPIRNDVYWSPTQGDIPVDSACLPQDAEGHTAMPDCTPGQIARAQQIVNGRQAQQDHDNAVFWAGVQAFFDISAKLTQDASNAVIDGVKWGAKWTWDHIGAISGVAGVCSAIPGADVVCAPIALVTGGVAAVKDTIGCINSTNKEDCWLPVGDLLSMGSGFFFGRAAAAERGGQFEKAADATVRFFGGAINALGAYFNTALDFHIPLPR
jgi:RHS repeat-associated protein